MAVPVADRVRRRRETLKAQGLRPLQIWVPDTSRPGFAEECRRQSQAVASADRTDTGLLELLDSALADLDE